MPSLTKHRKTAWDPQSKASDPGDGQSTPTSPPDAALSLGMAFVEAAGARKKSRGDDAAAAPLPGTSSSAGGLGEGTVTAPEMSSMVLSQMDQLR